MDECKPLPGTTAMSLTVLGTAGGASMVGERMAPMVGAKTAGVGAARRRGAARVEDGDGAAVGARVFCGFRADGRAPAPADEARSTARGCIAAACIFTILNSILRLHTVVCASRVRKSGSDASRPRRDDNGTHAPPGDVAVTAGQ